MLVWIYSKQTQLLFQDKRKLDVILQRLKEVGNCVLQYSLGMMKRFR